MSLDVGVVLVRVDVSTKPKRPPGFPDLNPGELARYIIDLTGTKLQNTNQCILSGIQ